MDWRRKTTRNEAVCSVRGCLNSGVRMLMHSFPRNPLRCRKWLEALGELYDDKKRPLPLCRMFTRYLCCEHFDMSDYKSKKLKYCAIPSLKLFEQRQEEKNARIQQALDSVASEINESSPGNEDDCTESEFPPDSAQPTLIEEHDELDDKVEINSRYISVQPMLIQLSDGGVDNTEQTSQFISLQPMFIEQNNDRAAPQKLVEPESAAAKIERDAGTLERDDSKSVAAESVKLQRMNRRLQQKDRKLRQQSLKMATLEKLIFQLRIDNVTMKQECLKLLTRLRKAKKIKSATRNAR